MWYVTIYSASSKSDILHHDRRSSMWVSSFRVPYNLLVSLLFAQSPAQAVSVGNTATMTVSAVTVDNVSEESVTLI